MQKRVIHARQTIDPHHWKMAVPPALLAMPIVGLGILISSVSIVTSKPPFYLPYIAVCLLLFWAFCLYRVHVTLDVRDGGPASNYQRTSPIKALLLGTVGGPLAPYVASVVISASLDILGIVTRAVGEVFPSDLPIMQSGIWLLSSNATLATLSIGIVVATLCQQQLAKGIERAIAAVNGKPSQRVSLAGLMLAICVVTPGCFWALGSTSLSGTFGLEQDWQARLYLVAFLGFLGAYSVLSWWCYRLGAAVAGSSKSRLHHDHNPSPQNSIESANTGNAA